MDRLNEILVSIDYEIKNKIATNMKLADEYYNANKELIDSTFYEAIKNLFELTNKAQLERGKKKINYLCINILYSSILTGENDFLFSLKDKSLYLDKVETQIYWSPKFVFENIEKDMVDLTKSLKRKFSRVSEFELSEVRYNYVLLHYEIALKYIFELAISLKEHKYLDYIEKEDKFDVLFSLYMEKARPIKI